MLIQEIEPKEAFEKLQNEENTVLIDVRTDAEFTFVGQIDLSSINKDVILLPWKIFPAMNVNARFQMILERNLQEKFGENAKNAQLIFICRSGGRSYEAASFIESLGYKNCFNLTGGFEGDLDSKGHRSNINGWKANNLPWRQ